MTDREEVLIIGEKSGWSIFEQLKMLLSGNICGARRSVSSYTEQPDSNQITDYSLDGSPFIKLDHSVNSTLEVYSTEVETEAEAKFTVTKPLTVSENRSCNVSTGSNAQPKIFNLTKDNGENNDTTITSSKPETIDIVQTKEFCFDQSFLTSKIWRLIMFIILSAYFERFYLRKPSAINRFSESDVVFEATDSTIIQKVSQSDLVAELVVQFSLIQALESDVFIETVDEHLVTQKVKPALVVADIDEVTGQQETKSDTADDNIDELLPPISALHSLDMDCDPSGDINQDLDSTPIPVVDVPVEYAKQLYHHTITESEEL